MKKRVNAGGTHCGYFPSQAMAPVILLVALLQAVQAQAVAHVHKIEGCEHKAADSAHARGRRNDKHDDHLVACGLQKFNTLIKDKCNRALPENCSLTRTEGWS